MLELLARHPYLRDLTVSTLIALGVYAVCAAVIRYLWPRGSIGNARVSPEGGTRY